MSNVRIDVNTILVRDVRGGMDAQEEAGERRDALRAAIAGLSASDRALVEADLAGANISERARQAGRSPSADRQQLSRIMKKLPAATRGQYEQARAAEGAAIEAGGAPGDDDAEPDERATTLHLFRTMLKHSTADHPEVWTVMEWMKAHPEDPRVIVLRHDIEAAQRAEFAGDAAGRRAAFTRAQRYYRAIKRAMEPGDLP